MSSSILDRKIDYWEHQLLDLGKRNKMINYRETKRATLKITEPSLSDLFHRLAVKEEKLTFQRAIDKETDIRVFSILSLLESLSSPLPVTVGDIGTESSVMERQKTLKHLLSKNRAPIFYICRLVLSNGRTAKERPRNGSSLLWYWFRLYCHWNR